MEICHILPIAYLKDSRFSNLNQLHLVEFSEYISNKEYSDYYDHLDRNSNFLMLDCSVGIGKSFDIDRDTKDYLDVARHLKPNELIIPDALQDNKKTHYLLKEFWPKFKESGLKNSGIKLMGVLQLDNLSDLTTTAKAFQLKGVKTLGIPWKIDWPRETPASHFPTFCRVMNRVEVLNNLIRCFDENILSISNIHLLGCADAIEYYGLYHTDRIRSTDTSTAYLHAKHNIKYGETGLPVEKVSEHINFSDDVNENNIELLIHNIEMIKKFISFKR